MSTEKVEITEKRIKRDYKSRASSEYRLNMAYFKILSDYFNILSQHPEIQKEQKISDISFIRYKDFLNTVDLVNYYGETNIIFKYYDTLINFSFDKYRQQLDLFYTLVVTSKDPIDISGDVIYKEILNNAIRCSDLKGSYMEMPKNDFSWKKRDLERRGFDDIFLPKTLMSDLELYVKVFNLKGKTLRYLMVGSPGTGKTESTLIIANELNKRGVTILKTPVCDLLKEKVELAHVLAPTIILFDDLDLSIGSRTKGGYSPKELQEFLDTLDGTDKMDSNVGIIATTNSSQLLDLAAQRPGRFEKILCFDGLSKKNVGNIILKSLKYNFNITSSNNPDVIKLYYNKRVIEALYNSKVSGAYVFNTVNVINLKAEMSTDNITENWVIHEIENELSVSEKIRKIDHLTDDKMKRSKSMGFGSSIDDENDEEYDDILGTEKCPEEQVRRDSSNGATERY